MNLNELRNKAYKCACDHGFHDDEKSNEHFLMLVISELSEAVEADRKGKRADVESYNILSKASIERTGNPRYFNEVAFCHKIKDTIEDELADAVIRLLDLAGLKAIDTNGIIVLSDVVSKKKTFTENCYAIIKDIVNYKYTLQENVNYSTRQIFKLAEFLGIDLSWHIEAKMKYNELRVAKHGKKY